MKLLRATFPALSAATLWFACSADTPAPPPPFDPWAHKPCETVEDCPAALTQLCGMRSCTDGFCALEIYEQSRSDVRGDCWVAICDSDGYGVERPDLTDLPEDGNPCTKDYCKEKGDHVYRTNEPLDPGPVPNGSGYCDGHGNIVECLEAEDCGNAALACSRDQRCVPLHCVNGVRDESEGETGYDCGGACDGCALNAPCNNGTDCRSGVCEDNELCARPSCDDGIKNGVETDVDCGGTSCDPCTDGQDCYGEGDCVNRTCFAGKCQPRTCDDGKRNGDEEDVDCGADCPPCQF